MVRRLGKAVRIGRRMESLEDRDKISVIVPVYNAESYLPQCIEGILGQTHENLEILLVDDGSTDFSGRICDEYAGKDKRIRVVHKANGGLVTARKAGISRATGSYIGFVDADDYIEGDMYRYMLENIVASGADFIHTGYVEEKGGRSREIHGFDDGTYDLEGMDERRGFLSRYVLCARRGREVMPSIWSKLFKRELIEKSYFPLPDGQQYGEDVLCLCLCILQSRRIALRKKAFYHYAVRQDSLSHLSGADYFINEAELNHHIINAIRNYDAECCMKLKGEMCYFLGNRYLDSINRISNGGACMPQYRFGGIESLRGKKVAIYGAGIVGQSYYSQFCKYKDIKIAAWFDSDWESCRFDYAEVSDGKSVADGYEFDRIIIALLDEAAAAEIGEMLKGSGILEEKIVWMEPEDALDWNSRRAGESER